MRIVIDTNVLVSGVFFGGFPRKILSSVVGQKITACATAEIINEYEEIVQEMIDRKQGHIDNAILTPQFHSSSASFSIFFAGSSIPDAGTIKSLTP